MEQWSGGGEQQPLEIPEEAWVWTGEFRPLATARTRADLISEAGGLHQTWRRTILPPPLTVADFAEALAIFLHEHAHIFGHDGDRGFTDALTELIETLVRFRASMDGYEGEWDAARVQVVAERREQKRMPEQASLTERLALLTEPEMRNLLHRIPEVVLKRLM